MAIKILREQRTKGYAHRSKICGLWCQDSNSTLVQKLRDSKKCKIVSRYQRKSGIYFF